MEMNTVRFCAMPQVSCRKDDDSAVLYNPDVDKAIIINSTGLEIWQFLQQPHSQQAIVQHLENIFAAGTETLALDVEKFLTQLDDDFLQVEYA